MVGGLGGAFVVTGIMWRASVVGSRGVAGSRGRGMVNFADETAKVASMDQFFYFILECFAFFRSVTMVAMVLAILGHVGVGRCGCLVWWGEEISLEGFV